MKNKTFQVFSCHIKKLVFLLLSSLLFSMVAQAQRVSGRVTDENNEPLPGVSIVIKGTATGTTTDDTGRYSVEARDNDVLIFSFIGFVTREIPVNGQKEINVRLVLSVQELGDVVVTALGISKESRSLGYSATNVQTEEIAVNRTPNPLNALQGKVAGMNISSLGTGPGGTSKIRIRGQSSIAGQNNPLIVVNGVPIDNTNFGVSTGNQGDDSGAISVRGGGIFSDGGDGLSSINPDDIESMSVLKGAAASALYGARAKDGVIMITTKTKGVDKGIGLSYNMNFTSETPLDFTDYQKAYGQGEGGIRPNSPNPTSGEWSFGEKITSGMTQILYNNLTVPYEAQGSRIKGFYRNGQNLTNTVTLSSTGDKGSFYMSLTSADNKGITPNNKFAKKGINIGFNYNLSKKLSYSGNVNYSFENNQNPPNIANQDNSIPTTLMALANTMPLKVLEENAYDANRDEYVWSRFRNRTNPYFVLNEQFHNIRRDRIFGNITVKYDLLTWLSVQGRFGEDYWSRDEDYNNFPTGQASRGPAPAGFVNGMYTQEARRFRETNLDFLVTAEKEFGDINILATAGGNQMRRRSDVNSVQVTDFVIRDLYTVQNGRAKDPYYGLSTQGVNSLYGSAEASWNRAIYLNGTLRNDVFSTLSPENRSILYPSASLSYVFSEQLKSLSWLDFGKLRLAYAKVGSDSDVPPYADQLFYGINSNLATTPSGASVPVGGPSGSTVPNPNLRPMSVEEYEIGMELKLFDNRLSLDLAAYHKLTTDQIVQAQISNASGFVNTRINSGQSQNNGFEALAIIVPVRTKNFIWELTANTSYNKTKVLSLLTETKGEKITIGTHVFNGEVRQVVGEEMGQIAGFGYNRNDQGERIFLANGLPQRTPDLVLFGSALPKWVGGFINSFNYKGVTFSFLIDYKLGNKVLSGTNFNAVRHGLHKMTLEGREGGVTAKGVSINGGPNTAVTPVQTYWEHLRSQALVEAVVYNGGYWKLRQVTVGYDFTKHIPSSWPVKGVKLDLIANNVLILKKWIDNIDPETFGFSSDNLVGLESPGVPTTRGLGVNLNFKF